MCNENNVSAKTEPWGTLLTPSVELNYYFQNYQKFQNQQVVFCQWGTIKTMKKHYFEYPYVSIYKLEEFGGLSCQKPLINLI